MDVGLVVGVVVIGFVHGVLPDHGWPIAATYALNRNRRLLYGLLAALILGIGHLVSSVALVLAYFWFSTFAAFAEGPWLGYVAGALLIALGVHEYRHGGHGHHDHDGDAHGHDHHHHGESDRHGSDDPAAGHHHDRDSHHRHDHERERGGHVHVGRPTESDRGLLGRIRARFPGGGGHRHLDEEHAERGLMALGTTALLLGFAHEEPIQILAICVGTDACLELMVIYSLAVIVAIVLPTLLLIAGYEHHRERIERLTPYLPTITAVVLVGMGLAFITGVV
ncbi:ABC transporter permease [Natrarchaeobius oligotrophus]|uniref:ABC transporter permease n=1 Tax=Natrarchaeobius chitinivorans TaxID=1679083 RepID=A0A3N6PHA9_NATCH|nr:ABC transporter permease [Natrarchaeobius chitinivorans]RQG99929.1 ABC transporter permease [Natrarchaeobius chitinivorans]